VVYSRLSWSSCVISPTRIVQFFPISIWHTIMASNMPAIANWYNASNPCSPSRSSEQPTSSSMPSMNVRRRPVCQRLVTMSWSLWANLSNYKLRICEFVSQADPRPTSSLSLALWHSVLFPYIARADRSRPSQNTSNLWLTTILRCEHGERQTRSVSLMCS
jgi:hypothetical protein